MEKSTNLCILAKVNTCYNEFARFIFIFMSGTKTSGRPGGNPDIVKFRFTTEREEPLREKLQIRVPASMKQQIQQQDNWQEFVRQAIAIALEQESSSVKQA
jgi:hypothetical protein